ncbi:hypothetical protein [Nonomuraea sp. NPDC050202]|jgi:hypothetical protein|uniref:hypothetical protein n=1 Tax=Nonomuraea sp. NPDC050202 TaxID=3155035 RepID=UPI0033D20475
MRRDAGCAPVLGYLATLAALVWSGATTDITALAVLCWVLVGSAVLVLIADVLVD